MIRLHNRNSSFLFTAADPRLPSLTSLILTFVEFSLKMPLRVVMTYSHKMQVADAL